MRIKTRTQAFIYRYCRRVETFSGAPVMCRIRCRHDGSTTSRGRRIMQQESATGSGPPARTFLHPSFSGCDTGGSSSISACRCAAIPAVRMQNRVSVLVRNRPSKVYPNRQCRDRATTSLRQCFEERDWTARRYGLSPFMVGTSRCLGRDITVRSGEKGPLLHDL